MKMGNKLKKIISIQNQKDERIALNYLKIITTSKKKKTEPRKSYSQDNLIKIFFMGVLWYRPSFRLGLFNFLYE